MGSTEEGWRREGVEMDLGRALSVQRGSVLAETESQNVGSST